MFQGHISELQPSCLINMHPFRKILSIENTIVLTPHITKTSSEAKYSLFIQACCLCRNPSSRMDLFEVLFGRSRLENGGKKKHFKAHSNKTPLFSLHGHVDLEISDAFWPTSLSLGSEFVCICMCEPDKTFPDLTLWESLLCIHLNVVLCQVWKERTGQDILPYRSI